MKFSEREKAFEDKFAHDEEILFKVRARRNKQAGLWAAEKLGKAGDSAHEYADALVVQMLDKGDLLKRIHSDLHESGVSVTEEDLFKKIDEFVVAARKYIMEKI